MQHKTDKQQAPSAPWLTRGMCGAALVLFGFVLCFPGAALAHAGGPGGFWGGLVHPVLGPDHLLAMISVGIISVKMGGRAIWTVPTTFVVVTGLSGWVAHMFLTVMPEVESGVALSVLLLGLMIAWRHAFSLPLGMLCVGFFAMFHGGAHGLELPPAGEALVYGIGFLCGTAALHLVGVMYGVLAGRHHPRIQTGLGYVIAVIGLLMFMMRQGFIDF